MAKTKKPIKIHMSTKMRTLRGNIRCFCGKTFSSGDKERLKRHVTSNIEDLNCLECVEAILSVWDAPGRRFFYMRQLMTLEEAENTVSHK